MIKIGYAKEGKATSRESARSGGRGKVEQTGGR